MLKNRSEAMREHFSERELVLIREAMDSLAAYYKGQANISTNDVTKDYKAGCLKKAKEINSIYKTFCL